MLDDQVGKIRGVHQQEGALISGHDVNRLDARLPIPERANRLLDTLRKALPFLVLMTRFATGCSGELRAKQRELTTELDIAKLVDRFNRFSNRVGL